MSTERRIKSLKLRQRSLMTSFNAITRFVDEFDDERDAIQVPVPLESIIKLWEDLNIVQMELESLDEANLDEQLKLRTKLESAYYRSKGMLLAKNKILVPSVSSSPSTSRGPSSSSQVRLPDVKLPVFTGNLDSWLNFHDLFVSLVHSSVELSNIQKFYYLRSSLSGNALKLIQTIPLSANNYVVAWNLPIEHFQNPARLKQSYVDALFEFPSLKKESASELHSLVEKFEANVKVLQQLGEMVQCWDILLIRMLSIRLDPTTRRDWEEFSTTKDAISFKDLTSFIQRRVTVLQNIQGSTVDIPFSGQAKKSTQRPVASHNAAPSNARKCIVCNNQHPLYQCVTFSKMAPEDKEKEVRRNHLCRNCLRKGHQAKDCSSTSTCRKCRGRHHTQLCSSQPPASSGPKTTHFTDEKSTPAASTSNQPTASVSATVEPASLASVSQGRKAILLATAVVIVVDDSGTEYTARALPDSGSECCFVTESFSQRIKAQRKKVNLPISGIGQSSAHARHKLFSTIRSRTGRYSTNLEFLVLPKITIDLPSTSVDTSDWEIPPSIQLADPSFCSTNPIDLILGAEIFFDLFKVSGRIPLGNNLPVLVNSVLGWVVSGRSSHGQPIAPIVANVATVTDVHRLMERFWSIEEDNASPCYSVEEAACEEHFRRTVTRNTEGRYIVRLPLKQDVLSSLVDKRRTALRRFHQLEGRLVRNPDLHHQYRVFVEEYHALGHMQRVTDYENPPTPCYHLPHHAVVREDSTTTKLRVVFDASCKTPNGPSLNYALLVGPTVQEDLRSIIIRARTHPVMLIADIKQMYRQVLLDEQDTPLQRIVWRVSPDTPMETFELKTVTYGTASAPYLATRVLQQLADDERDEYPEAAEVLRKDFYVDDLFSGGRNVAETIPLRKQLDALLLKDGFELRKWASNEQAVLQDSPAENRAVQGPVDLDRDPCIKTLGLHWEPSTDQLRYKIQLLPSTTDAPLTKRIALSYIARLFDPLGLVGPVVTTAKMFMQTLWTLKDDDGKIWSWDNELPTAIKERWQEYQSQLHQLNDLRIDRCILLSNPASVQLHFFSDASEHAYGSCVYVRSTDASSAVKVCLVTAKSKVAPLKKQSIPRLELCGALLSAELYEKVTSSLQIHTETFFWVDSTIVLSWLNSSLSTWTTFVANRVSKIQTTTQNCSWNHVAGQQNPADHISRGIPAETLIQNDLWWQGSQWLQSDQRDWPIQQPNANQPPEVLMEARKVPAAVTSAAVEPSFVDQFVETFSNFQHMVRVAAYCRRFLQNCRKTSTARAESEHLTVDEQKEAEATIIRLIQQQSFSNQYKALQQAQTVSAKSRIPRITAARPFSSTGVDYWGPILLKPPHRRAAPAKAYVAVFVCFATKAVHIELVSDLSTAKFIEALRRFVSRRGLCNEIYSDNGRNFVGAANELRQIVRSKDHQQTIARDCAENGIRWHFNPPRASHFGGLWEAAIASAQKHFVRVLGTHTLAYDSMETLLAQIECCLNSRPLVPLSDESTDLEVFTPGHFLTGAALKAVPDIDVTDIPFNRLRQWQPIQKMFQQLWKRWHLEYLSTLQSRSKWCNPPVPIQKNQLVVIKDENSPPMSWPIGRIIELHPGDDGTTRVVTLQTPNGRYTRPVSKICLLPISSAAEKLNSTPTHCKHVNASRIINFQHDRRYSPVSASST
ncbi:uncharacterized protein LOC131680198 [Topomyia yanbarensis]|uniref:uncharacterized protein LOC131680198 n=1 Tax=Topomyia yanbarensis TaxID=2498891 RepID=UPI00273C5F9B|nr:uncharacterized protein LOC131680198 [Topomyia yanbarensis]